MELLSKTTTIAIAVAAAIAVATAVGVITTRGRPCERNAAALRQESAMDSTVAPEQ